MTNTQTPAEIDTELAANWLAQAKVLSRLVSAQRTIDNPNRTVQYYIDQAEQDLVKFAAELAELRAAAAPGEREYADKQWNRYFIVNNTGGHVHRSMNCTTCYPTTQFGWLPQLSDCDEAEMVAEYGEMACTVCFPDAPTFKGFNDGTSKLAQYSEAEKAQKAAEKEARNAAKQAKLLNAEDVFKDAGGYKVTTVAAAKTALREAAALVAGFGYDYQRDAAPATREAARTALMNKGVTAEELDTIETKAVKTAQKRGY